VPQIEAVLITKVCVDMNATCFNGWGWDLSYPTLHLRKKQFLIVLTVTAEGTRPRAQTFCLLIVHVPERIS
jgi:hypothetical protein